MASSVSWLACLFPIRQAKKDPAAPLFALNVFFRLICFPLALALPSWSMSTVRQRATFTTPHFDITVARQHQDRVPEWSAQLEALWQHHHQFYQFAPRQKIQCVLIDEEDTPNGFAFANNAWIVLYLTPLNFQLRGATDWFANVASHELAHVFTLQKMKADSRLLGISIFAEWSSVKQRQFGQADFLFDPNSTPAWLAEGLAQYGAYRTGGDTLDAHRRALIEQANQDGSLHSLAEMATFTADGRRSEMVYAQGFSLVSWLYQSYGDSLVNHMMDISAQHGWRRGFQKAFGQSPDEIYSRWKPTLPKRPAQVDASFQRVTRPIPQGLAYAVESHPVFGPKGELCFLSSRSNAYGMQDLICQDRGSFQERVMRNVQAPLHLSADGKSLLFPAVRVKVGTGARLSNAYRYDFKTKTVSKITETQGVMAVAQARDGRLLTLQSRGGISKIVAHPISKKKKKALTLTALPGQDFRDITPGRSDSEWVVTVVQGVSADLYSLNSNSGELKPLQTTAAQEIDPFVADSALYFSSDREGSHAIYRSTDSGLTRLTPLQEPAFTPMVRNDTLFTTHYEAKGFVLRYAPLVAQGATLPPDTLPASKPMPPLAPLPAKALGYDRTAMEWLGYVLDFGVVEYRASHTRVQVSEDPLRKENFVLDPCGPISVAGGQSIWMDPGQNSQFALASSLGYCHDGQLHSQLYLKDAQFAYTLQTFAPDILLFGNLENHLFLLGQDTVKTRLLTLYQIALALNFNLHDHIALSPLFLYQGMTADLSSAGDNTEHGLGLAAGAQLQFQRLDFDVDEITQGLSANAAALLITSGNLQSQVELAAFGNVQHALFLSAQGRLQKSLGTQDALTTEGWIMAHLRLPLRTRIGFGQGWGPLLQGMTVIAGIGGMSEESEGTDEALSGIMKRPYPPKVPSSRFYKAIDLPSTQSVNEDIALTQLGLQIKIMGIFPHVAYLRAVMISPMNDWTSPWWSFNVSL